MSKFHIDLEQLTQKCFGNDELVEKLIIRFQASLPQLVDELVMATNQNNMVEVRNIAHRLKGEAGTMCAGEISSLAERICEMAYAQHNKESALLIAELSCNISTSPITQGTPAMTVEHH